MRESVQVKQRDGPSDRTMLQPAASRLAVSFLAFAAATFTRPDTISSKRCALRKCDWRTFGSDAAAASERALLAMFRYCSITSLTDYLALVFLRPLVPSPIDLARVRRVSA